jgi:hypothetical protein
MLERLKSEWRIMYSAGTLIWSRIKLALGTIVLAITQSGVDLSTVISDARALAAVKIGSALVAMDGLASEVIRRKGATDLTSTPTETK